MSQDSLCFLFIKYYYYKKNYISYSYKIPIREPKKVIQK